MPPSLCYNAFFTFCFALILVAVLGQIDRRLLIRAFTYRQTVPRIVGSVPRSVLNIELGRNYNRTTDYFPEILANISALSVYLEPQVDLTSDLFDPSKIYTLIGIDPDAPEPIYVPSKWESIRPPIRPRVTTKKPAFILDTEPKKDTKVPGNGTFLIWLWSNCKRSQNKKHRPYYISHTNYLQSYMHLMINFRGWHRAIYFLYEQKNEINAHEYIKDYTRNSLYTFNLTEFTNIYQLEGPMAGNIFKCLYNKVTLREISEFTAPYPIYQAQGRSQASTTKQIFKQIYVSCFILICMRVCK